MTKPLALLIAIIPAHTCDLVLGSKMRVHVTHYCPCETCCGKWATAVPRSERRTAYGRAVTLPGCAVDPRVVPYGSRLVFDDGMELIADDTGAAMRGAWEHFREIWVDVRCYTHVEAKQRGVYWADVEVR